MLVFRTKIRSEETCVWGGPGMAQNHGSGAWLFMRNDDTGESVELTLVRGPPPDDKRPLGTLVAGSSYAIDLDGAAAVIGQVNGKADSFLTCSLQVGFQMGKGSIQ